MEDLQANPLKVILVICDGADCDHDACEDDKDDWHDEVKFMVMLLVIRILPNLCIIDHHCHVVFFASVKELSDVCPCKVLLLRLNQHLLGI